MSSCRYQPRDLLAHRGAMLLLDEILGYDAHSLTAAIEVRPDKPFCNETGAPGWAGLEWLAQTAGAWVGAHQLDSGDKVDIGFLLGTRRYRGPDVFPPGRVLAQAAVVLFDETSGIAVMDCVLWPSSADAQGDILAAARVKLYQPPDVAQFLDQQTADQS